MRWAISRTRTASPSLGGKIRRFSINSPSNLVVRKLINASCAASLDGLAADNPTHRGIVAQAVGVVHVLVAGETTID